MTDSVEPAKPAARDVWYLSLFCVCLAINLFLMTRRWDAPLLDQHAFRQTQNAITVASMLEGGPRIAYELPVLGKPWSLPFEFPLYHWLVTAVAHAGVPLEQAGRLVSVIAFYLMLPLLLWLTRFVAEGRERLVPLMLLLVSPLYLFWPRTFMIESLALLLGVSYFVVLVALSRGGGGVLWAVAAVCAVAASLAKVTTFLVVLVPAAALTVAVIIREARRGNHRTAGIFAAGAGGTVAMAGVITAMWNRYADAIKRANPLADGFLTIDSLDTWLFGTWEQKTSWDTWRLMMDRSVSEVAGAPVIFGVVSPLILVGAISLTSRRYRTYALVCLAAFIAGPAVFTNLYAVHNYYFFANGIFLIAFGSFGILTVLRSGGRPARMTRLFLLPLLVAGLLWTYRYSAYAPRARYGEDDVLRFAATIRAHTGAADVIVMYGHDWNPTLPYYSRRRALMDRWYLGLDDPKFLAAMKALEGERIGAMVIAGRYRDDQAFVVSRAQYFGLDSRPALRHWLGDLYLRTQRAPLLNSGR